MVEQAAGSADLTQSQNKAQKKDRNRSIEQMQKYGRMMSQNGEKSFVVSGSHNRGYVPSQAGLMGLRGREISWREVYRRCVERTKRGKKGSGRSDKLKALRIARKIADGKKVPSEDEEFLMRFNVELWVAAKHLALLKEMKEMRKEEREEEKREQEEEQQKEEMKESLEQRLTSFDFDA